MFSVAVFVFHLLLCPLLSNGRFGDPVEDKLKDTLFRDMGQAYVSNFGVADTDANLQVILEDTVGVNEFWVVDFQPYGLNEDRYPVDVDTGNIEQENTGECSSVIFDGPFSSILGTGHYYTDEGNFRTVNVSLSNPGGNGDAVHKRLFEHYQRADEIREVTDKYGDNAELRDYNLQFRDNFGYFFNCTNTNGELIWRYSNTTDSVEYRTTMYLTNVRPRDPSDGTKGVSWVSSNVDLVYRIYRVAIVNFVFSSSALVQPTLNYVIIKPFPTDVLEPEPNKAWIKMEFETLIEAPAGELLSYIDSSLNYTSRDSIANLNEVLIESDSSSGRESCNLISQRCRQTWTFYMVLDLTGDLPVDDSPIDATGNFDFKFEKHVCADSTANSPNTDCSVIPDIDFTISLEVTIQTVVTLVDETIDEPTIVLESLQGANGEDLRGGALEGRRGVNHLEEVTMVVSYEPELLEDDFDLVLTLFMVCQQDYTSDPGGCLDATSAERYVAFLDEDFKYIHTPDEGEATTYELEDVSDEWNTSAEADPSSQQTLTDNSYDENTHLYTMKFINTALSQARLPYTITTVYKFVEKAGGRKRRSAVAAANKDRQIAVNTALVPYACPPSRKRRDLMDAVTYPQGHTVTMDFLGCPPRSTYNEKTKNCDCRRGEVYNTNSFECEKPLRDNKLVIEIVKDADETGSAPLLECSALLCFIGSLVLYIFSYLV